MTHELIACKSNLDNLIETIGSKYAPDKRVEVFSIETVIADKDMLLKGETSNKVAYKELLAKARKTLPHIKDCIRILPDEVVGDNNWGVIYNSVANLHSQPAHNSEMVSQVLLGMPVRILDKSDDWQRIQTPEGYIGWLSGSVRKLSHKELKEYLAKPKIVVTSRCANSNILPNSQSQTVSDIVLGNMLNVEGEEEDFYMVSYPDGREAYVEKQNAQEVERWISKIELTGESIVQTAKQLMGVPYLWGGTSSKGLDCSGFTKTVYWLHGVIIERDASQQIKHGVEIDNIGHFDTAQKGDLVFFGIKPTAEKPKEQVVHVGIYIGNQQFIHASDYIRINSFNRKSKLYDEYNTNRYLRTMRYIGATETEGISSFNLHPYYT